ncbi:Porphobilinogen deaminase [Lachnospiraceae bacterium TWA4]|nr:Porphobilinogen deaminase [Lachnospiraceae bacterium TWA4]
MDNIRIGSRESKLAVIQSKMVMAYIKENFPDKNVELVTMKTTGDIILDRNLDQVGGKGLFVKELDKALMDDRTDLSVHSLKDMPMQVPDELPIVAFSKREDPRDVLILPEGKTEIDFSLPIGCSSLRRMLQFGTLYPQAKFEPCRGNVITRLSKLDSGQYSAIILAAAGVKRLGLEHRISKYFEPEEMLPAAGQGILSIQGRKGKDYSFIEGFADEFGTLAALSERSFIRTLDGGCTSPIAAHATISDGQIRLVGLYYEEGGTGYLKGEKVASADRESAEQLGKDLATQLKNLYKEGKRS